MFDSDFRFGIGQIELAGVESDLLNGLKNVVPLKLLQHVRI